VRVGGDAGLQAAILRRLQEAANAMTVTTTDTIEGSGHPLGFRVRPGERTAALVNAPGRETLRVEARAMGAHQKEAVVTEESSGAAWRLVSDEGAYLKGSDQAPFPLGFFNAGLQADLLGRLRRAADECDASIETARIRLDNRYAFSGSFFKGDGRGEAMPAVVDVALRGSAPAARMREIVERAVRASPAMAAMRSPLENTFALYVNGRRRAVLGKPEAGADVADPLKRYARPPEPLDAARDAAGIIEKLPADADAGGAAPMPSSSARLEIDVLGRGRLVEDALTRVETALARPVGSRFVFRTEERAGPVHAPSGLVLLAAGIAFCYMTQLLRYAEYLKYRVRAIRMVQLTPFALDAGPEGLVGRAEPVETHLFLHGEEPDEVMQRLLEMGANTCYLHAALGARLPPQVALAPDGEAVG
jgi:uncharacterized OsmC-like protein